MAFDDKQIEQLGALCSCFCTLDEVAAIMEMEPSDVDSECIDTFGCGFDKASERFSAKARAAIRREQIRLAMDGDAKMLQLLGKHYLGQTDNPSAAAKPTEANREYPLYVIQSQRLAKTANRRGAAAG